jgi:hypothetical protein
MEKAAPLLPCCVFSAVSPLNYLGRERASKRANMQQQQALDARPTAKGMMEVHTGKGPLASLLLTYWNL